MEENKERHIGFSDEEIYEAAENDLDLTWGGC